MNDGANTTTTTATISPFFSLCLYLKLLRCIAALYLSLSVAKAEHSNSNSRFEVTPTTTTRATKLFANVQHKVKLKKLKRQKESAST